MQAQPNEYKFICRGCGKEVIRTRHRGRPATVCSKACRAEATRVSANLWYHANYERARRQPSRQPEAQRMSNRAYYKANREREIQRALAYARGPGKQAKCARDSARYALTKGSPIAELFTLDEIFDRDSGWCYLCEQDVDRKDATMDHVIPVTKGGPHTRVNVRLAHRSCNTRKGNKLLPEAA
jgi:5-methylcytosine-specific restriction endonuclease McrA